MKRETLLTIAVVVLLLLNLGTLGFLFVQNSKMGGRGADKLIIEGLGLSPEQIDTFETLKEEHQGQMRERDHLQKEAQKEFWGLLRQPNPDTTLTQSSLNRWSELEKQKRMLTFEHFKKIRAICNPEQQKRFDNLIDDISKALMPPPPNHPPR